uniref:Uncharacterized protein n=1 Tax=Grammatophora oceanica TaxID=210454 RepID=A0A7S1VQW9_9STRA|mmetsp:Transcript_52178/g.77914  ORF Transcript_52178/g.77914 Transcript_52178/m.77914 type:complete len:112 (+) Transcript_52178:117-452(+)|eukprot:CAMPEP_0194042722 /NCGR_PEP_ID=MMETSP0009_2-20130614/14468_1 /TAXON_ID=210454 /ORGANISM="Grammatophora oceanica, Strain CCMP 410" /LENGTH=111 /DNA_ID=CAMNT_0038686673 /DNA_START=90 /DNA_END=425 /DNA_ORIENTATION=+
MFSKTTVVALICLTAQSTAWVMNGPARVSTTQLNAYRQSYQYKLASMEGQETAEYKAAMYGPEGGSSPGAGLPEDSVPGASFAAAAPAVDPALQEFLAGFEEAAALMESKY